jgi:hypothetical protein
VNIPQNVGPNEKDLVLLSFSPSQPSQGEPTITHFGNHRSQPSTLDGIFGMVPKVLGAKKSMANLIFSMFPDNANCVPTIPLGSRTIFISLEDFVFFP